MTKFGDCRVHSPGPTILMIYHTELHPIPTSFRRVFYTSVSRPSSSFTRFCTVGSWLVVSLNTNEPGCGSMIVPCACFVVRLMSSCISPNQKPNSDSIYLQRLSCVPLLLLVLTHAQSTDSREDFLELN
jgi:hypothetical protein